MIWGTVSSGMGLGRERIRFADREVVVVVTVGAETDHLLELENFILHGLYFRFSQT